MMFWRKNSTVLTINSCSDVNERMKTITVDIYHKIMTRPHDGNDERRTKTRVKQQQQY